ncbi:glucoamylase family protein [Thermoactinospora rubra]|uniref:glucoamylase family protein n=1 Tax=Thermoactinospora rubra TaxID=1088767 RepID=UPI00117D5FF2|nr:glucoamylase family protein [Thermoactinospora rubra]
MLKIVLSGVLALGPLHPPADTLRTYAAATWRSMAAMVEPATGLPADKVTGDLKTRAKVTSPTNVATYLWSVFAARDIGLIGRREAEARVAKALDSVARLERHAPTGQFFNWYDPATLQLVRTWPDTGDPVRPFASSVDNGWLAAALMMVPQAVPSQGAKARAILQTMDFRAYYDPAARPDAGTGLLRGGFWVERPEGCSVETPSGLFMTCHHYGAPAETRIATYVGIALGQLPREHYFGLYRTFPDAGCDWAWQEQKPVGSWKEYLGVKVWQGTYGYRGMRFVPTWGGSMFEELMNDLIVPENVWAAKSWGRNHPVVVRAHIEHGLHEAGYGYWGFSPSNDPHGGYREYGVDPLGMDAAGYTSDRERTSVDPGYEGCRPAQPEPASYGDGVVTPHAVFLAYRYAPRQALDNLARLRRNFDAYGPGGFYDAIAVRSGQVSKYHLALDQGMIMAAIGNALAGDAMRRYFATPQVAAKLKPVLSLEEWDAR